MRHLLFILATLLLVAACGSESDDAETRADDVISAFDEAGLPVGSTFIFTTDNDPNERLGRPGEYTEKINFHDTRLEKQTNSDGQISTDSGGSVEVFGSDDDAKKWLDYVEALNSIGRTYNYQHGKVVLRLAFALTPGQAEEYKAILDDL